MLRPAGGPLSWGSIAYGEYQGRSARAGGWGELFSGEGSSCRTLAAAGRLIREHNFNGVCVAEIMKAAGLSLPAADLLLSVRMRQLR
jgi:hypothetical protein